MCVLHAIQMFLLKTQEKRGGGFRKLRLPLYILAYCRSTDCYLKHVAVILFLPIDKTKYKICYTCDQIHFWIKKQLALDIGKQVWLWLSQSLPYHSPNMLINCSVWPQVPYYSLHLWAGSSALPVVPYHSPHRWASYPVGICVVH